MMLLLDPFHVSSPGARIIVVCFGFLALLLTSSYTANMAVFVNWSQVSSSITSAQVEGDSADLVICF
jgi:hypothetical protein